MIKLIVSDLDGTLFNAAHRLDEISAEAIRRAQDAGIAFMVATGRAKENVIPYFEEFHIRCPKILLNGAMYLDENDCLEKSIQMNYDDVRMIMDHMQKHDVIGHIFYDGGIACTDPNRMREEFKLRLKTREHLSDAELEDLIDKDGFCHFDQKIDDIDSFLEKKPIVYKMEAFANDEEAIQAIREALYNVSHLAVSNSIGDNIEVTDVKAQKGYMLEYVCNQMGIKKDEVVTIGDSMNDESMLRDFPNSYAMQNACEKIKQVATYQTTTNHEHGVVKIIEQILAKQGR